MAKIAHYTYQNPALVPVDTEALEDGEPLEAGALDWAATVKAAGFDPADEEVSISRLTEAWNGHRGGDLVVTGLAAEGHPFAIVAYDHGGRQ